MKACVLFIIHNNYDILEIQELDREGLFLTATRTL
jgi:hypothetical protein